MVKIAYIRKLPNGKYRVFSEKGRNLGTYDSKEQAKKRLRQIEFFKHKKASANIDLSNLDNITYSSVVRELNKLVDKTALNDFIGSYKKCFDQLVSSGKENPEEQALPAALLHLKKLHNIQLAKK